MLAVCEGLNLGWQIYGNFIYYQPKSTVVDACQKQYNGSFLMTMCLLLMLGYCYFLIYFLFITLYLFMKVQRASRARSARSHSLRLMRSISRVRFSEELFGPLGEENECIICMTQFTRDDMITKLECPGKHYYHTACIESWI